MTRNSQKVKTKTIHRHLRGVGDGKTNNSNHLGDESCEATSRVQPTAYSCWRRDEREEKGGQGSRSTVATKYFASAHLLLQEVTDLFRETSDIDDMTEICEAWSYRFPCTRRDSIRQ